MRYNFILILIEINDYEENLFKTTKHKSTGCLCHDLFLKYISLSESGRKTFYKYSYKVSYTYF